MKNMDMNVFTFVAVVAEIDGVAWGMERKKKSIEISIAWILTRKIMKHCPVCVTCWWCCGGIPMNLSLFGAGDGGGRQHVVISGS